MLKKIVVMSLSVFIVLGVCSLPVSAKSVEWDGVTALETGNTYYVSQELILRRSLNIPAGARVVVREGGIVTLRSDDLQLRVAGSLIVLYGGLCELRRGELIINPGGSVEVYGEFNQFRDTSMKISGGFNTYNTGEVKTSGIITIFTTGEIMTRGIFAQTISGIISTSGKLTIDRPGELRVAGSMSITLSGSINNLGYLSIGVNANFVNSGTITLSRDSEYTRTGSLVNTKSGKFIDNREKIEYEMMTAALLANEPKVSIRGIDVSYAQGDINWEQVPLSGAEFVIIRAGRGTVSDEWPMREDTHFRQNIEGALSVGLDVGVYFYSYAKSVREAREEARFYVSLLEEYEITYPVILDIEEDMDITQQEATRIVQTFFEILIENNYYPMLYSYKTWLEKYIEPRVLDTYAIWLAQLGRTVTYEGPYHIWQFSHNGRINGIEGPVDLNISYIDFPEILRKHRLNNL
ncbi:MAG: hypothetical protein FWH05_06500 [Oscillospiraceae bacterium]|nr:hypothetical protein [Oscillospiraceae bacterium]